MLGSMKSRFPATAAVLGLAAWLVCAAEVQAQPERLSQTGLFGPDGDILPGNLPFSPQYPLWTDGASKRRWIRLPAGKAVDGAQPDAWSFPRGTRLWKEFAFAGRPVETRMLDLGADGEWRFTTYLWQDDGRDAVRVPASGFPRGVEVGAGQRHIIPGEADCRACHEGRSTPVLGFSALQLSVDRDPNAPHAETPPADAVDLQSLIARKLLRRFPVALQAQPPRIDAPTPKGRAAMGYLHANCGTCHNLDGPLTAVGLWLAQDVARNDSADVALQTLTAKGKFSIPGQSGGSHRLVPGSPRMSAVAFRMSSRDPFVRMPPLGTTVIDEAGLSLIESWIEELGATMIPQTE